MTAACRIERWRGYFTSRFYAVADDGAPLLESAPFRLGAASVSPDHATAKQAHADLLAALAAAGWQPDEAGPDWYATRLIRALGGESETARKLTVVAPQERVEPPSPIALARPTAVPLRGSVLLAAAIAVIGVRRLR
jgi:uncharacterized membrane protein